MGGRIILSKVKKFDLFMFPTYPSISVVKNGNWARTHRTCYNLLISEYLKAKQLFVPLP